MGTSLFIQLPISLLFALVLSTGVFGEKFFRTVYFIPVVISSMVIGRLWISIFGTEYGLLNVSVRNFIPDFEFPWLTDPRTAYLTTVIPAVWQYIGYHMIIIYSGIKSIPSEFYEAALIDGATGAKATRYITLPLLIPVLKTSIVLCIVGSIKAFDLVFIMIGGGDPKNVSQVPATLMYSNLFKKGLYGYGSAQAFFIVIECIVISIIITRIFKSPNENMNIKKRVVKK
jgi:raffinose/stachyose/melibiose transport system permease protein